MDGKWAGHGAGLSIVGWGGGTERVSGWGEAPLTKMGTLEEDTWPHSAWAVLALTRGATQGPFGSPRAVPITLTGFQTSTLILNKPHRLLPPQWRERGP